VSRPRRNQLPPDLRPPLEIFRGVSRQILPQARYRVSLARRTNMQPQGLTEPADQARYRSWRMKRLSSSTLDLPSKTTVHLWAIWSRILTTSSNRLSGSPVSVLTARTTFRVFFPNDMFFQGRMRPSVFLPYPF